MNFKMFPKSVNYCVNTVLVTTVIIGFSEMSNAQTDSAKVTSDSANSKFNLTAPQDTVIDTLAAKVVSAANETPVKDTIIRNDSSKSNPAGATNSNEYVFSQTWKNTSQVTYRCVKILDIDKDGKNEIVLCTENVVGLFRLNNAVLEKITEYKAGRGANILSVDAGELNGSDGVHLFVSAANSSMSSCKSFVLGYKNGAFQVIQKNMGCFFKLIAFRNGIKELYSQSTPSDNRSYGDVYTMIYTNNKYVTKNRIKPLDRFSVLGLSYCNGPTPSTSYYCCYDNEGNFMLLNANNYQVEYESTEKFSGTPDHLILSTNDVGDENRLYLCPSSWSADLNNDSKPEIIIVKNHEIFNNMMANMKFYNRSHFEVFTVENSLNVMSKWISSKMNGYISGLDYGDSNNDGKNELFVVRVVKSGDSFFQKPMVELSTFSL